MKGLKEQTMFKYRSTILALSVIALLTVAVYSNVLKGEFQFDDYSIVSEDFHQFRVTREVLSLSGFLKGLLSAQRPVTKLTFWLSYAIGGTSEWAFHSINLLIHLISLVVVWAFVRRLLKDAAMEDTEYLPLAVTGLWALHPLQTEAVSYIVQRSEALASLLYLLALLSFIRALEVKNTKKLLFFYAGGLALFGLSWGAKPITMTLPLVFVLYVFAFRPKDQLKRAGMFMVPVLVIGLVAGTKMLLSFKGSAHVGFDIKGLSSKDYLLTQMVALVYYLKLIFFPLHQSIDHDFPVFRDLFEWPVVVSAVFWTALIGFSIWALVRKESYPWQKVAGFGFLWFLLVLSPTSSFVPLKDLLVEHRLYLAMLGVVMVAVTVAYMFLPSRVVLAGVITCVCILSVLTYQRNFVWQSKIALWEDAVRNSPRKARAHNNLGRAYLEKGMIKEAESEFLKTIAIDPSHVSAYNNLSNIYLKLGFYRKAAEYAGLALALDPAFVNARINLGTAYGYMGMDREALQEFLESLKYMPENPGLYNNIGVIYAKMGKREDAERYFKQAIALKPDYPDPYLNLGILFINSGYYQRAIEPLRRFLSLRPNHPAGLYHLIVSLKKTGRTREAERYFLLLRSVSPEMAERLGDIKS